MLRVYRCMFLLNSGQTCNRPCIRSEGCFYHWKSKIRIPCKKCGKPTASEPGLCRVHANSYYVTKCVSGRKLV